MLRALAVGTAFMFCLLIGTVAGAVFVLASLYLPLQIYEFGKERGARIAAVPGSNASQAELLTACAEVTFTDDHKIIGVYLAGEAGGLALRVDNQSIIFAQPVKTMRFGSAQRN